MTGPIYNVVQFSYRLALIPDSLQGRVNSTFRLLAFGFIPLGAAAGGFLLERIGTTATVAVFTALYVLLAIADHLQSARPERQADRAGRATIRRAMTLGRPRAALAPRALAPGRCWSSC
jgi:hypothetical protein